MIFRRNGGLLRALTPLRVRVAIVASAALLTVFVLPWFVPVPSSQVISDAQAVGFNNRVAIIGLALSCLVLALVVRSARRSGEVVGIPSCVRTDPVEREQRVSRALFITVTLLTLTMVAVVAYVARFIPFSHASYFVDVVLRVEAGGSPYSEIGFMYGPLLLYGPLALARAVRTIGVDVFAAYYLFVAISHVVGLTFAIYVLNRLNVSRRVRNEAFAALGIFGVFQFDLGLNYTSLRFVVPFACFLWAINSVSVSAREWRRCLAPPLAVVMAAAVSPEMGMAVFVALAVALGWMASSDFGSAKVPLAGLIFGGAITAALWPAGALGSFAGGALNFPVLPGIPLIFFLATMLMVAYGIGRVDEGSDRATAMLTAGWFALTLVMIAPVLGRADFGHVYWNGLGAMWTCAAIVDFLWNRGTSYVRLMGAIFILAMVVYTAPWFGGVFQSGVASGSLRQTTVIRVAGLLGKSEATTQRVWKQVRATVVSDEEISILSNEPNLFFAAPLSGPLGEALVESGNLVPSYVNPAGYVVGSEFEKAVAQLGAAHTVAVPAQWYDEYRSADLPGSASQAGPIMEVPGEVLGGMWTGTLFWFPIKLQGRNPVFDPSLSFASVLRQDWRPVRRTEHFVLFERAMP